MVVPDALKKLPVVPEIVLAFIVLPVNSPVTVAAPAIANVSA